MTGDERHFTSAAVSHSKVIGDAAESGRPIFRDAQDSEVTRTVRFSIATLISDRWQIGASIPIVDRSVSSGDTLNRASRLGDASLSLAFESIPETTYSEWKPRGFTFLGLTAPTGTSVYDGGLSDSSEITGGGFYVASIGQILVKRWTEWDLTAAPTIEFPFARSFGSSGPNTVHVHPGIRTALSLEGGFSPGSQAWRGGLGVSPQWSAPLHAESQRDGTSSSSSRLVWPVQASLSYAFPSEWSLRLAYVDETLIGPVRNSTLSRTFTLSGAFRVLR